MAPRRSKAAMAKEEEENKTRGSKRRRSQIPDPGEAERVVESDGLKNKLKKIIWLRNKGIFWWGGTLLSVYACWIILFLILKRFNKKVKEEDSEPVKLQEDAPLELTMEMDNSPNTLLNPISDTERRKRLREILLIILTKLKKKVEF